MPPVFKVNLDIPAEALNSSMEYILEISLPSEGNSTKTGYHFSTDYAGAMWFTVAVVLVYGVGTIGLLGITARRNRAMELMDKEVNAYLKSKFSAGGRAEFGRNNIKVKKPVYELIKTSDPSGQKEVWALKTEGETTIYQPTSFYCKPKQKLIRAKTWAGTLTKTTVDLKNSDAASNRSFGPLPPIMECSDSVLSDTDVHGIGETRKLSQAAITSEIITESSATLNNSSDARATFW
ncbi:hypothetical protein ElyMa_006062400 [Elysia marginata]|uniref:Uncharacterized protein n=1 Tax=Elysia marginata TaxID=1093978 RepID=A0AAV4GNG6_9GAST|nr:hypothetical protein ElyMa_006062400 [Elysia marginata]